MPEIKDRTKDLNKFRIIRRKIIRLPSQFYTIFRSPNVNCILYLNPVNYHILTSSRFLNRKNFSFYIDSSYFTVIFRLLLKLPVNRISFDMNSFAKEFFDYCVQHEKSIFFAGGTEYEILEFVRKIKLNFPDLKIKGFIDGYKSDDEIIHAWLNIGCSDFFIVGLGNIRQENFVLNLYDYITKSNYSNLSSCIITVGAFISQTARANNIYYYPDWVYRYNLRWVYRIFKERKVIKRLIINYPIALILIVKDIIKDLLYGLRRN